MSEVSTPHSELIAVLRRELAEHGSEPGPIHDWAPPYMQRPQQKANEAHAALDEIECLLEQYENAIYERDLHVTAGMQLEREKAELLEQLEATREVVEALWATRLTTGETAVVNTRELTDLHKLFREKP